MACRSVSGAAAAGFSDSPPDQWKLGRSASLRWASDPLSGATPRRPPLRWVGRRWINDEPVLSRCMP